MQPLGLVRGVRGSDALIYLFLPGGLPWIGLLNRSSARLSAEVHGAACSCS